MNIQNHFVPLMSYYHSLFKKINRLAIRDNVVDIIPQVTFPDNAFYEENISLFVEFCIILLTIEGAHLNLFEEDETLAFVEKNWNLNFSKLKNKFSSTNKICPTDIENFKKTYYTAESVRDKIEDNLRLEISMAEYRVNNYSGPEPEQYVEKIYTGDSLKWFKPFAKRGFKLKKTRI